MAMLKGVLTGEQVLRSRNTVTMMMRLRALAGGLIGAIIIGLLALMMAATGTGFGLPNFSSAAMRAPGLSWSDEALQRYAYWRLLELNNSNPQAVLQIVQGDLAPWLTAIRETAALDAYLQDQGLRPSVDRRIGDILSQQFPQEDGGLNVEAYLATLNNPIFLSLGIDAKRYEENIGQGLLRDSLAQLAEEMHRQLPPLLDARITLQITSERPIRTASIEIDPASLAAPSEEELRRRFEAVEGELSAATSRQVEGFYIPPEVLAEQAVVDEATVEEAYQAYAAGFRVEETRSHRRFVVTSEASADAARARLDAGEDFASVAESLNALITEVPLATAASTPLYLADALFEASGPGAIAGPIPPEDSQDFLAAYTLLEVTAVDETQPDSFETRAPQLRQTLAREALEARIETLSDALSDALSNTLNDTLGEIASDLELEAQRFSLTGLTRDGLLVDGRPTPAPFDEAAVLEEIFISATGEVIFPLQLDSGGLFAARIVAETPGPRPLTFEEARRQLEQSLRGEAAQAIATEQAEAVLADIAAGQSFIEAAAAQDLTVEARVTTHERLQAAGGLLAQARSLLMSSETASPGQTGSGGSILLFELEPLTQRNDAETLAQVAEGQAFVGRLLNQGFFEAWQQEIRLHYPVELDEARAQALLDPLLAALLGLGS